MTFHSLKSKIVASVKIVNFIELDFFCQQLRDVLKDKAILLIRGPLGVGKTKTVERLMRLLNVNVVSSPTFALHHHYKADAFIVDHFDLYRVQDEAELETVGLWECFSKKSGWVLIEWPDLIEISQLPTDWPIYFLDINFENQEQTKDIVRDFKLQLMQRDS